jgi:hypothetical protein
MAKSSKYTLLLPLAALGLYLRGSAPFLGQWDSFDYLKEIVSHSLSPLGVGRPVFIGYNIFLWESAKRIFRLEPLRVEIVAMAGTLIFGVLGLLVFRRLISKFLSPATTQMAVLAMAVSPLYAIYSGFVMTEIPMLATVLASAAILWNANDSHRDFRDIAGGILFGLSVGIREQALTLGAAFLWILWSRRFEAGARIRSIMLFLISAGTAIVAPVLGIWIHDPAGFSARVRTWFHAIPLDSIQFWKNFQASLLFTLSICPGAWIAAAGAGLCFLFKKNKIENSRPCIPSPFWGIVCCLFLPIAVLWRDADVQIHPRYALVALPGALILCVCLYNRWVPSKKGPLVWAAVQILVFGISILSISPWRQAQTERIEFAHQVMKAVPDKGLIIAGSYSPIFDYYRGIGVRPEWRILWSGWNWDAKISEDRICASWADDVPVYLTSGPLGWAYYESEFLALHFYLKDHKREMIIPGLFRISP